MASRSPAYTFFLLVISVINPLSFQTCMAVSNISLGLTLYANDESQPWTSPSLDFAFGFRRLLGDVEQYLLAIWFDKIPEKTIVWSANGEYPFPRDSKLELTTSGLLVVTSPERWQLWKTDNNNKGIPSHGAMLDTGNFVITSQGNGSIWESFNAPTDTILPTQVLRRGDQLISSAAENDYRPGKFQLRLLKDGTMMLNQVDTITSNPYQAYFSVGNVSQLVFNESGVIHIASNGTNVDLTTVNGTAANFTAMSVKNGDYYHRATVNFDGTFTLYSYPKTSSNGSGSWRVMATVPGNICLSIYDYLGSGPCGFNSYCQVDSDARPICSCPPGFTFFNPKNKYSGCKQEYVTFGQDCEQGGYQTPQGRFHFEEVPRADWPLAGYEMLYPSTISDCKNSCLHDCYCSVAIFQPIRPGDSGNCWKKRLPLSNGRLDEAVERVAFIKILNATKSSKENKKVTLILSTLLGTSVFLNLFSITAVSFAVFRLCKGQLRNLRRCSVARDLDTNLRCFSFKDLEVATNHFKEELGRGAFGTVYKGVLDAGSINLQIAVKKLDKVLQDGEKEFRTEVNVIGRTHHKNLVRLIGYCDDDEHRILVYEFMQNGSLSSFLFGDLRPSWQQRLQIASGIVRGLVYLHEECNKQIIHCDIKPQNILLDDSFTAKISDFGLAKLMINNQTRTLTGVRGTRGYVAPEWFRNMPITAKVDVYSFGVMLLEIICSMKAMKVEMETAVTMIDWAYECFSQRKLEKLVEEDEEARNDGKRLEKLVMVALWCVQEEVHLRPSIRVVSLMIEDVLEVPVPPFPFPSSSLSVSN